MKLDKPPQLDYEAAMRLDQGSRELVPTPSQERA